MIEIDGSYGEGGGQILRSALSLACLLQKPFRIYRIRKGRAHPGLAPQHLVAVQAAQRVSRAEVSGAAKGSTELSFSPRAVTGGDYRFDIGTAGSTTLVLQTLFPALLFCGTDSSVTITGGTHVPFSPSYNYLAEVFVPFLRRLGLDVRLEVVSFGFYPKGGGCVVAHIRSAKEVSPLRAMERGRLLTVDGTSHVADLPESIAERQRAALLAEIQPRIGVLPAPPRIDIGFAETLSPGTFVFIRGKSEHSIAGFTALGARGKRAEVVGQEAAQEFLTYYRTERALDPHLADQAVPYLSLSARESAFTTSCISMHLLTNLWLISLFHPFRYRIEGEMGGPGAVFINSG